MSVEDALFDYVINDCVVVEDDVFAFFATLDPQKEGKAEYQHLSPCRLVHYFRAQDRWEWLDIPRTGVRSSAAGFAADGSRETIFTCSMNEVISFRYDRGPNGTEKQIPFDTVLVPKGIRFIGDHFFLAGADSTIVRRDGPESWTRLYRQTEGVEVSLEAIDGFAEDDVYVAGSDEEFGVEGLFHFDGDQLVLQAVPDHYVRRGFHGVALCCAPDGSVYAVQRNGGLIAGNKDEGWRTLIRPEDVRTNYMDGMVWFKGTVYATSPDWLYRFDGHNWEPINPEAGFKPIAWGFVSANENVLLAAGPFGASIFDGTEWTPIYAQVSLEEIALKEALEKQVSAVEEVLDMFGVDRHRD
jgi:hypothetical protein